MSKSSSDDPNQEQVSAEAENAQASELNDAVDSQDTLPEDVGPEPEDQPEFDTAPEPEAAAHDHDAEDGAREGSSLAGMALRFLILVLVVFGVALWAMPRLVPYLPDSVAKHLTPGQVVMDTRLAAIEAKLDSGASEQMAKLEAEIDALKARLEAAESEVATAKTAAENAAGSAQTATVSEDVLANAASAASRAAEAADIATSAATEAGTVASSAIRNAAALARRLTGFEAQISALSDEVGAIGEGLANSGTSGGGDGASPELAAAYGALKARVDGLAAQMGGSGYITETDAAKFATQDDLRATRTALASDLTAALDKMPAPEDIATKAEVSAAQATVSTDVGELATRLTSVEAQATEAQAAATAAEAEVGGAIRDARLRSAVATLSARITNGLPFAGPLGEVENLSNTTAPDALGTVAEVGVPTASRLLAGFGQVTQDAITADLRASGDAGMFGQATARLRALAKGRPKGAKEGDDTSAILSRVEAALTAGDVNVAVDQAADLSEAAAAAIDGWLGQLTARAAADAALEEYVAGLGGSQG